MKFKIYIILFLSIFLSACGRVQTSPVAETSTPGVTDKEIILGSSSALSGHNGYLGYNYIRGAEAYFNYINEKGGVHGRLINIISYDDQYDPNKCILNTQKLINDNNVFALFNYVGTPTTVKALPLINEAQIPLVGIFSGAQALRTPVNKNVFNIRASYNEELEQAVGHIYRDLKISEFAVFYQNDAYGHDGLDGSIRALNLLGLKPILTVFYIRGTMDVEAAARQIIESPAEAVLMIGTYSPSAKLVRLVKEAGRRPLFQSVSFGGPDEIIKELGAYGDGVAVSQVVPLSEITDINERNESVEFVNLFARYFPQETPNMVSLEGFINAQVLAEALGSAGPDLTRQKLITAMETMRGYKPDQNLTVNFSKISHQGLKNVYFTYIKDGKFNVFENWEVLREFIGANK